MRICREAGGRVSTNFLVRDLDLEHLQGPDGRRLEVVADGLPLFGGAQLAVDTNVVRGDGTARRGAANVDGVALEAARKRKVRTFPRSHGSPPTSPSSVTSKELGGLSGRGPAQTPSSVSPYRGTPPRVPLGG